MLFVQKIAKKWAAAEAAGKTPETSDYPELEVGDKVVGVVKDPALLAALAVLEEQVENFHRTWPERPEESDQRDQAQATLANLEESRKLVWYELRRAFQAREIPDLSLRRGYEYPVLVQPAEKKREGFDAITGSLSELLSLSGGCGDPNCTVCNGGRGARMGAMAMDPRIMDLISRIR